jgi:RimJ/RimL family protein N-acetyltransferase
MLKSKHVTLRAIEREDLKRLHELNANVDLVLGGDGSWSPLPLATFDKRFERRLEDREPAWFAIEVDGRLVGDIELHSRDRRSCVTSFGVAIYDREYVGRGYGREAIGLLLDWAFLIQNYERVWLTTWHTNERALRCYRSLGFAEEGRQRRQIYVEGQYVDVVLMGLLRDEWLAHKGETNAEGR